jgi:hypothetical protein
VIKGKIKLTITKEHLDQLNFTKYFPCYRQTLETEKYYVNENSSIWQMFDEESPEWVHQLAKQIPQDFEHHVVSVINIPPGQTVPYHQDKHYMLQERYGIGETWRYLIFLEDWKPGHYFEVSDQPIVKWSSGEWIKFHQQDWHLGGNMGFEPFYSAQVTIKCS